MILVLLRETGLSEKMSSLLSQAQQWIDLVQPEGGDHELELKGFIDAIGKSIGRVGMKYFDCFSMEFTVQ